MIAHSLVRYRWQGPKAHIQWVCLRMQDGRNPGLRGMAADRERMSSRASPGAGCVGSAQSARMGEPGGHAKLSWDRALEDADVLQAEAGIILSNVGVLFCGAVVLSLQAPTTCPSAKSVWPGQRGCCTPGPVHMLAETTCNLRSLGTRRRAWWRSSGLLRSHDTPLFRACPINALDQLREPA